MLVIPWYLMASKFGWIDTYWGIMFPSMATAFGVFLMRQFFETVPNDFLEAARVDGLNEFAIWRKVALPLVTPALSALAIFTFRGNWTAFFWPLIVTTDQSLYTLPVGLSSFAVEQSIAWELIMTGAALATIPTAWQQREMAAGGRSGSSVLPFHQRHLVETVCLGAQALADRMSFGEAGRMNRHGHHRESRSAFRALR